MDGVLIKSIPRTIRDPDLLAWIGVVRELREQRGWSLADLASRSGLSHQGLSLLENHKREPKGDTMTRVSRALGLQPSAVMAAAEQRAALWPRRCQTCNYCCIECGVLKWWTPERGCFCSGR